jgi:hypothetical protein
MTVSFTEFSCMRRAPLLAVVAKMTPKINIPNQK